MWVFMAFMVGVLIADFYSRYKVLKVMKQLEKVCDTGDEMWQGGVKYAMDQIKKIYG